MVPVDGREDPWLWTKTGSTTKGRPLLTDYERVGIFVRAEVVAKSRPSSRPPNTRVSSRLSELPRGKRPRLTGHEKALAPPQTELRSRTSIVQPPHGMRLG